MLLGSSYSVLLYFSELAVRDPLNLFVNCRGTAKHALGAEDTRIASDSTAKSLLFSSPRYAACINDGEITCLSESAIAYVEQKLTLVYTVIIQDSVSQYGEEH